MYSSSTSDARPPAARDQRELPLALWLWLAAQLRHHRLRRRARSERRRLRRKQRRAARAAGLARRPAAQAAPAMSESASQIFLGAKKSCFANDFGFGFGLFIVGKVNINVRFI